MGVNLRGLVPIETVDLKDLSGKTLAVDAFNALYQFLAIIRQPDGTPLKDARIPRVRLRTVGRNPHQQLFFALCK